MGSGGCLGHGTKFHRAVIVPVRCRKVLNGISLRPPDAQLRAHTAQGALCPLTGDGSLVQYLRVILGGRLAWAEPHVLDDTGCPAAKVVDDRSTGEAVVIHEARQRFVATFSRQCDSIAQLIDSLSQLGADGPVDSLRRMLHNIAGHAGTIGFPKVGAGAAAIEALIADAPPIEFDSRSALQLVAALREDFATDLTSGCAEASIDLNPAPCSETGKILVVEDDP